MDHGCPEMKCTYFHRNIVGKKTTQNDRSHAMDISRIIKVILKNYHPKNWKMSHLTVKKGIFKKIQSLQFLMVQGSLNPNIRFLGEKL